MNESPDHEMRDVLLGAVPPLPEPEDRLGEVRARIRRNRLRAGAAAAGAVVAVAGLAVVALPQALPDEQRFAPARPGEPVYQGTAMVIENPEHGPRLCAPAQPQTLELPQSVPGCAAPANEIVGWDWREVDAESAGGVSWGTYFVVGTWDGARFRLTEPARPSEVGIEDMPGFPSTDFTSPCPEPAGGWQLDDPAKATEEALQAAFAQAATSPEYAGGWIDEGALPGRYPASAVLTLLFTEDTGGHAQRIRDVWGGALCVSAAEHSEAELTAAQDGILADTSDPNILSANAEVLANQVVVEVLIATPELQRGFDEQYGAGLVTVEGWLEPAG